MNIQTIKIENLKEYDNNPRINDNAVEAVAESIKQFGFKVPIVVDKNNVIVAGHTRLRAAKLLELADVPCIIADDLTDEQIKAYRLADNKTNELAEWDFSKLEEELAELSSFELDFDMSDFGFSSDTFLTSDEETENDSQDDEEINADTNYNYQEQYGVIVICESEEEQERVYTELQESGYNCKVVAV